MGKEVKEQEIKFEDRKKVVFNGNEVELHPIHADKLVQKGKAKEVK